MDVQRRINWYKWGVNARSRARRRRSAFLRFRRPANRRKERNSRCDTRLYVFGKRNAVPSKRCLFRQHAIWMRGPKSQLACRADLGDSNGPRLAHMSKNSKVFLTTIPPKPTVALQLFSSDSTLVLRPPSEFFPWMESRWIWIRCRSCLRWLRCTFRSPNGMDLSTVTTSRPKSTHLSNGWSRKGFSATQRRAFSKPRLERMLRHTHLRQQQNRIAVPTTMSMQMKMSM